MASNRRPQNPKSTRQQGRERDVYRQALRAAATPKPSGAVYSRKGRNVNRYGE